MNRSEKKKQKIIKEKTEQILIGSLLGDGSLVKKHCNAYFKESHCTKQKEYLLWKRGYLDEFNPRIEECSYFDKRTSKYYHQIFLYTKVHPFLTKYYELFYPNNKKVLTNKVMLDKIKPLALAVWYCDDGTFDYLNWTGRISTCISYEDNYLLTEILSDRFNIKCNINKDKKSYRLYFGVKEIKKFLALIKEHVPHCMDYKLGALINSNIKKMEVKRAERTSKEKDRYRRKRLGINYNPEDEEE